MTLMLLTVYFAHIFYAQNRSAIFSPLVAIGGKGKLMRFHKTRKEERATYSYEYSMADERGGYRTQKLVLKPGEQGVTEALIKRLHSLDDSEVYNNIKNARPSKTTANKEDAAKWREQFTTNFITEHGYAPNKEDVDFFCREKFPANWAEPIDKGFDDDMGEDKTRLALAISTSQEEENPTADRLHEVMSGMTDRQREVLTLVKLEGYSLTETAAIIGTSIPNVKKHLDKAIEYIRKNF